jgi:5'-deoxynucleotidase YfbR-like HD superfamily hydrolase
MRHLTELFNILEISRNQPQYGYALWGGNMRLGNIAEHQYMVTLIAWQLATSINAKGGKLDIQKVLEIALIHDLGELFGGDIGLIYGTHNPKAKKLAKEFEAENLNFIAKLFGSDAQRVEAIGHETEKLETDESLIVKTADLLEHCHYKFFMDVFVKADIDIITDRLKNMGQKLSDIRAKAFMTQFSKEWQAAMKKSTTFGQTVSKTLKNHGTRN